jgi:hypothetical protein
VNEQARVLKLKNGRRCVPNRKWVGHKWAEGSEINAIQVSIKTGVDDQTTKYLSSSNSGACLCR